MRVALLISGYLRSYDVNIESIKNVIINKFDVVDTYLHITKNECSEDKYLNLINEDNDIKNITNHLSPIVTIIEDNYEYNENRLVNNVINQWCKLYKLNQLKTINEISSGVKYDLVIRYRPDIHIKSNESFVIDPSPHTIYIPDDSKMDKSRLVNPGDGYICDAIAFGDSNSMDTYFDIYKQLELLVGSVGHVSESILYHYLITNNLRYRLVDLEYEFILSKCNVFAICGDSGSGKSTLGDLLKGVFSDSFMLECDRYHRWERGHKNWDSVTHLNPNANYITKMSEDIFNLKVGKDIHQVDYDHHSGKFTKKQTINSSDNLIVCGLHSLYTDSVYDLKIFMDTEDILKKKWKIKRDIRDRGYSIQKVLDSIVKREEDFNEFIRPQKEYADLIVKFFSKDEIDLNEYDKPDNLGLELTISNKFNITGILDRLDEHSVSYMISKQSDKFYNLIFDEYQDVELFNNKEMPKTNTFYDYVMYFIFNLTFTN